MPSYHVGNRAQIEVTHMQKSIGIMVLASLAFAAPAFASDKEESDKRIIIKKHFDGGVDEFDANKDGKVSRKEFTKGSKNRSAERFKVLDKDGDGYLSKDERSSRMVRHMRVPRIEIDMEGLNEELDAALEQVDAELARVEVEVERAMADQEHSFSFAFGHHEGREPHHMKRLDTNKDGKVSREEYLARRDRQFNEIDKNNDGVLSEEEMAAHKPSRRMKRVWVPKPEGEK